MKYIKEIFSEKTILILLMVFTFGGFFGFIYEELFYRIDLGYFVKRGTTFGPWIPIYAFGALFIVVATERYRAKPVILLFVSTVISGVLEFVTGYVLFNAFNVRLWDYNTEIWNWGNIGGYICFRSLAFFGASAVCLQYIVHPIINKISDNISERLFKIIVLVPTMLFVSDIILSTFLNIKKIR